MRINFDPGVPDEDVWFLNFGGGGKNACADQASDLVRVTETTDPVNLDQWTVTPASPDSIACLEKHVGGKVKNKFCGRYHMPFSFTITPNTPAP